MHLRKPGPATGRLQTSWQCGGLCPCSPAPGSPPSSADGDRTGEPGPTPHCQLAKNRKVLSLFVQRAHGHPQRELQGLRLASREAELRVTFLAGSAHLKRSGGTCSPVSGGTVCGRPWPQVLQILGRCGEEGERSPGALSWVSVSISLCLCPYLSLCLSLFLSICLCVYLLSLVASVSIYLYLYFSLSSLRYCTLALCYFYQTLTSVM